MAIKLILQSARQDDRAGGFGDRVIQTLAHLAASTAFGRLRYNRYSLLALVCRDSWVACSPSSPELAQTADSLNALKHFLVHYKAWIMAVLAPLGGFWAVFLVALIDAAFFGIPLDPVVAFYVHVDPRRAIVYAVLGSLGSAFGSTVPYLIGYKGGEALVVKKLGRQRFARMHALSEKYGDMALIIPALMPPGFPFKACALMAGVTEMRYPHFLLSIFVGRLLRFVILGMMIIAYGPQILSFLTASFLHHRVATFAVIAVIVAAIIYLIRQSKTRTPSEVETETSVA